MKTGTIIVVYCCILTLSTSLQSQTYVPELYNAKVKVTPSVKINAYAFNLRDIILAPGSSFYHARSMDSAYLCLISPQRLLHRFYTHAGLKARDSIYGGWESSGLAGHTLGHYLSAASMMYAATGSKTLKSKVDEIIHDLKVIQQVRKTGYLGAIPQEDSIFAKVKKGEIRSSGFDLNGGWSPWYTVHKIMAGLCDAYLYANNRDALIIVKKMADWTGNIVSGLDDSTRLKMLNCEYGGMNDVLANIYALTGEKKYLDLSFKFYDEFVMGQLAQGIDPLPGKHSNTNVPKALGSARQYELTSSSREHNIASFFWQSMTNHHTYAIGGNSNYEYCGEPDQLNDRLSDNTCETCNTYNMLKLTRHLFSWNPGSDYMDYYERALYNHILASQHPGTGMMTYFVPLRMGTKKSFSDTFNTFTCCVGSGMENHSKYQEQIYSHDGQHILYVNLFIPSVLSWKQGKMKITQSGDFLVNPGSYIHLDNQPPTNRVIAIRKPAWSTNVDIAINGKTLSEQNISNGYIYLQHRWKKNDLIRINFHPELYTEPMPDNPDRVAIKYGPLVLAADLGLYPPKELDIPVLLTSDKNIAHWLKPNQEKTLTFTTLPGITQSGITTLKPFYQVFDDYYSVYFDFLTDTQWENIKLDYEAEQNRIAKLEQQMVDYLDLGVDEDEQSHHLSFTERSYVDEALGKKGREARAENHFQFDLKVSPSNPNQLVLTYLGDDKNRTWDLLIDGQLLTTIDWPGGKTGKFYDLYYDLPPAWTMNKRVVVIKILANHGKTAGRIFGARTIIKD